MSQRRMPSGQGPARRGEASAASGPRSAGQRSYGQRASDQRAGGRRASARPWSDPAGRPGSRAAVPASEPRAEHRAGLRPSAVRRAAGPARRTKAPRRPPRISGRAAALGLLLLALTLAYAYPVRVYLAQQAEINQMQQGQEEQRKRIQDLVEQLKRWDDPDYVAAQARIRLHMVHAGEKIYIVKAEEPSTAEPGTPSDAPFLSQLWSSLQAADEPPQP